MRGICSGRGARKEAVRSIMNGGYTRNGTYLTGHGRENVFGPVAMAGLDVMEKETGEIAESAAIARVPYPHGQGIQG